MKTFRAISSVGQSAVLTLQRSSVRAGYRPLEMVGARFVWGGIAVAASHRQPFLHL